MKRVRALSFAFLFAMMAVVSSCNDPVNIAPESPPPLPQPEQSLIGSLLQTTGLLSCTPLPRDSATKTIGTDGGVISVGKHSLVIPPGALTRNTTITAVAPSGKVNLVEFSPEGLQFEKPAVLTMNYQNCNLLGRLVPKRIAYVNDNLRILEYILSLDLLNLRTVTGRLKHFSGYAVAW